jgi:hypothetical protein
MLRDPLVVTLVEIPLRMFRILQGEGRKPEPAGSPKSKNGDVIPQEQERGNCASRKKKGTAETAVPFFFSDKL